MNSILKTIEIAILTFTLLLIPAIKSRGFEITTDYTSIIYNNENHLHEFNNSIYLGRYNYLVRNKNIITVRDEIKFKIDLVIDRIKKILDMYPKDLKFKIALCGTENDVQKAYRIIYGKKVDYSAFYALKGDMVYFSADNVELSVVAHEFAHVIMEKYFEVSPPVKVHELLARYAERHIAD